MESDKSYPLGKFAFWIAIGIIGIPILLNITIPIKHNLVSIIGDEKNWLTFWGSYIGAIFGGFITNLRIFGGLMTMY